MKKILKFALALLPLAVMSSCAADDPIIDDSDGIAKKSETRYLQVTLSSANGAPGTRNPGDLPDTEGTEGFKPYDPDDDVYKAENKIKTLDFYFYDRNKQYHSHVNMPLDNSLDSNNDGAMDPDIQSGEANVYGFYHCNVPIELVQGETLPNYVICIVNAVEANKYEHKSMAEAQAVQLYDLYSPEDPQDTYFGMSNSVYYGRDKVTGESNVLIMATPFDSSKLKTKTELEKLQATSISTDPNVTQAEKDAARDELEASKIDIYVERYASKVTLDLSSTTYTAYPTKAYPLNDSEEGTVVSDIALTFVPKGWNVNATEKSFFMIKAFREPKTTTTGSQATDPGYTETFATKDQLDKLLFPNWNSETEHRSYWSRTPGYYINDYPVVSDDVINRNGADSGQYSVDYWSYDQAQPLDDDKIMDKYVMETTMMYTRLTGEGMPDQYLPTASIPSVIITGNYTINNKEVDFYIYGKDKDGKNRIYSGADNNIEGASNIKDKMLNDQTVVMTQQTITNSDNTTKVIYTPLNNKSATEGTFKGFFDVVHPSEQVRNMPTSALSGEADNLSEIKVAADIVVLQVNAANNQLYFYNTIAGDYTPITAENMNLVNRLLLQNLGGAHYYNKGMAFFSAPIFHWGWYRTGTGTGNDNAGKKMAEWDWKKMKTGDFGIVRNHIYTMKIGKIEGLGTGIKDPNEPIVPPADKVGYAVHFHVNIQKWAVLPTQTWDF